MNNFCYIPQLSIQDTAVQLDRFNFFSSAREIARNNFCPMEGPRHFLNHFRNISFATTVHWKITKLSLNNNRLAYVDIQVACSHPVLESLAIADNIQWNTYLLSLCCVCQRLDIWICQVTCLT